MDERLIAEIEKLDVDQAKWAAEFDLSLAAVIASLATDADALIDRLFANGRATTTAEVSSNLRTLTMWQADLPSLINRSGYQDAVDTLLARLDEGAGRLNAYFGELAGDGFVVSTYINVAEALAAQVRGLLLGGIESGLSSALSQAMNWQVLSRATGAEMRTAMRAILDANGLAVRNISTTASDALYTFSRGYSLAVAEGLKLKYYFYMGTRIVTTRDFCNQRYGRPYTQAEVESWASLTWGGKIPGTTTVTIFWYLGGYRCRHRLLPISKSMYDYLINKTNGKDN